MKRTKKNKKEFTSADVNAVFEGKGFTKDYIRAVIRGDRNNGDILKALRTAKEKREKLITRLANS
jgi:hypothetical protein